MMNSKQFIRLIWQHRPKTWIIAVALVAGIVETLLALFIPLVTMGLVEEIAVTGLQVMTIGILAAVFAIQTSMSAVSIYAMSYVGEFMIRGLRNKLWERMLRFTVPYYDNNSTGETMSRLTNDTNVMKDFIIGHVISFLSGVISIIGGISILLWMDWRMTLLMLIAIPAAFVILWPLGSKMFSISQKTQEETALLQGDLGRVLGDIRLVKASVSEQLEEKQGKGRIASLFRFGLQEAKIMSIVSPLMMTVMLIILVLLIGYGGVRVAQGDLSSGQLVAIILYMFQIIMPFTQMASFFTQFQKAQGAAERLAQLLQQPLEQAIVIAENDAYKGGAEAIPSLYFQQLQFRYKEDRPILQEVDFVVEAGKMTAIVGPSGSGKTTLFALLERFYLPDHGEIRYGARAIQHIPLDEWRQKIAYVSQDSPVMAGSIHYNLTYGLQQVTESAILDALEQANLLSFINSLPEGLQTLVGERGVMLSGGQRQRIAIARAMLRNPDILLLDEATAHLDSESEKLVQQAMEKLMNNRTTLVIAHRLSTIVHANQIIVLEQGIVTGTGTHADLLQHHKLYAKLAKQQYVEQQVS
ncbi:ABC transporter ATP-binding protein [Paenibacillus yanchengensis]|uniref:ABC transporter ATP-binding protein n=1 Tax=Paenibacillus yanchengensis TaxID=2035833 RepID=A0ABW4YIR7_9BACL